MWRNQAGEEGDTSRWWEQLLLRLVARESTRESGALKSQCGWRAENKGGHGKCRGGPGTPTMA